LVLPGWSGWHSGVAVPLRALPCKALHATTPRRARETRARRSYRSTWHPPVRLLRGFLTAGQPEDAEINVGIKSACRQMLFWPLGVVDRLRRNADQSILLTFDDGPHPEFTPAILDRLARYDARAVFFTVGARCEQHPEILRRMQAEGHA